MNDEPAKGADAPATSPPRSPAPNKTPAQKPDESAHRIGRGTWHLMTTAIAIGDIGFTLVALELWDFPAAILLFMAFLFGILGVFLGHMTGHAIHFRAYTRALVVGLLSSVYCGVLGTMRYNYMYLHDKDALFGNIVSSYGFIVVLVAASAILGNQLRYESPAEIAAERQRKVERQAQREADERARKEKQHETSDQIRRMKAETDKERAAARIQAHKSSDAQRQEQGFRNDVTAAQQAIKRGKEMESRVQITIRSLIAKTEEERRYAEALMRSYEGGFRMLWRGHDPAFHHASPDGAPLHAQIFVPTEESLRNALLKSDSSQ